MEYTSEISETDGICRVHVSGVFRRPDDSDQLKRFAVDTFTNHSCCLYLINLTQADVIGSTMSTYDAAIPESEVAESLRKIRTAFVRRELSEDDRFFEDVAVNRGFQLRGFEVIDEATKWLKQGDRT